MIVRKCDLAAVSEALNDLANLVTGGLLSPTAAAGELRRIDRMVKNLQTKKTGTAAL